MRKKPGAPKASPGTTATRASLIHSSASSALLDGRHNLAIEDIRAVALPALVHRLVLNFDAERDGVDADAVVNAALQRLDARG